MRVEIACRDRKYQDVPMIDALASDIATHLATAIARSVGDVRSLLPAGAENSSSGSLSAI